MFTTFQKIIIPRKTLKEKLHLCKGFKTECYECEFESQNFFASFVNAFPDSITAAKKNFFKTCEIPIITPKDKIVSKYKNRILINTVFEIFKNKSPNIIVFDPLGEMTDVFYIILLKSKSVTVVTDKKEKYEIENAEIFKKLGTSAAITERIPKNQKADAIISGKTEPFFKTAPMFSPEGNRDFGIENSNILPSLKNSIPSNADVFTAAAGLYNFCKVKKLGNIYCENPTYNGKIISLKAARKICGIN